jgi:hypothetical protein
MAKKNGGSKLVSPLFVGGKTNGEVAGPKGGTAPRDPFGYLSNSGQSAPGGSPSDKG